MQKIVALGYRDNSCKFYHFLPRKSGSWAIQFNYREHPHFVTQQAKSCRCSKWGCLCFSLVSYWHRYLYQYFCTNICICVQRLASIPEGTVWCRSMRTLMCLQKFCISLHQSAREKQGKGKNHIHLVGSLPDKPDSHQNFSTPGINGLLRKQITKPS